METIFPIGKEKRMSLTHAALDRAYGIAIASGDCGGSTSGNSKSFPTKYSGDSMQWENRFAKNGRNRMDRSGSECDQDSSPIRIDFAEKLLRSNIN